MGTGYIRPVKEVNRLDEFDPLNDLELSIVYGVHPDWYLLVTCWNNHFGRAYK